MILDRWRAYGYQGWIKYLDADGVRSYGKAAKAMVGKKFIFGNNKIWWLL
jgi:hypothetical protein